MFADILQTPAAQALVRRLETGEALAFSGVAASAQPFFAALISKIFPQRPIVVVAENLKTQESFQQDLETWLQVAGYKLQVEPRAEKTFNLQPSTFNLLFYPAWEIFPHEGKLPHADVISDRLQTLVALGDESKVQSPKSKVIVTSAVALLQKTFAPEDLKSRTRRLRRGDKIAPLDLTEWLEEQGYEPEAQVSQKGELALRGGIVDVFPPTRPWPVRLEFFGDELESLREFDPLTQVSRGEITEDTLPPAGEIGILNKGIQEPEARSQNADSKPSTFNLQLSTLLDYLPRETIFLLCDPEVARRSCGKLRAANSPRRSVFHFVAGFSGGIKPARLHVS